MKRFTARIAICACALLLIVGVLAGCSPGASSLSAEQQANRSYMSQVNAVMSELGDELDSFNKAVSRGDVVNMRTQAENAYKVLDKLAAIEPPEDLADVHKQYVDGTSKLREALNAYIDLYTEIDSGSFDQSTYNSRIAKVQSLYDEGVSTLQKADEAAASK